VSLTGDPDELTAALVRQAQAGERMIRMEGPEKTGKAAALLHDQGYSWPKIAEMTGIPMSTLYRRARPYVRVQERSRSED
jgi:hypothetical protein